MIKTATPLKSVNYTPQKPEDPLSGIAGREDDMFYESIQPLLKELTKNPQDETIQKILAYSKSK